MRYFQLFSLLLLLAGDIGSNCSNKLSSVAFAAATNTATATATARAENNLTGHDVLNIENYEKYITRFNQEDNELFKQHIPNSESWKYLRNNIPLFDCPDKEFEMTYYFRWWIYRKHIRKVDAPYISVDGTPKIIKYVITEFLPNVSWSGDFNTISAAAAHHIRGMY